MSVKGRTLTLIVGTNNEIIRARDVTINRSTNMMDDTSRISDGDEEVVPGTRSVSIDFDMTCHTGDSSYVALNTAYDASTEVAISVEMVDGTRTGVGFIENINETQPHEDIVTADITVKVSGGLTKGT